MNEAEKTAPNDEENKIVLFHAIDNGEMIVKILGFFVRTDKRMTVLLLAAILCLCLASCIYKTDIYAYKKCLYAYGILL